MAPSEASKMAYAFPRVVQQKCDLSCRVVTQSCSWQCRNNEIVKRAGIPVSLRNDCMAGDETQRTKTDDMDRGVERKGQVCVWANNPRPEHISEVQPWSCTAVATSYDSLLISR